MHKTIISDTSVLILLQNIGKLDILCKIYGNIIITPEVSQEFSEQLPECIKIISVKDKKYQDFLETQVDQGEASTIALAKEFNNPLLLLDDLKARKLAHQLKLNFTGTLGIIHKAKQKGIINKVKPIIDNLLKHNFHISELIVEEFLKLNNESIK